MRKLTITVSEAVYEGLYAKIGAGNISRFLNDLACAHVVDSAIAAGYAAMSLDKNREQQASDWTENLSHEAG